MQPSVPIHVCNAVPSSVTQPEGSIDLHANVVHTSSNGTSPPAAAAVQQQETHSWEEDSSSKAAGEEWQGTKPFTLKDVDWGLTGLLGIILLLSFGAYRVLDHFRVYQHNKRPAGPQIHTMVQRQPAAPPSSSTAPVFPPAKTRGSKSKSKQDKASKSSSAEKAAAAAAAAAPDAAAAAGSDGSSQAAGNSPTSSSAAAAALNPLSEVGAGALVPGFELPAGAPGAPQPSPLDAGFSSSMPAPWLGGVGQLDLPQMQLPEPLSQPPELPSIQVEPPAKAVTQAELAAMPSDPSLPSLRERAHIAMRASGAAVEASQRAAAYSAAASSAASRAAEAAEQAAVAASAVQAALEAAAEDAMAAAVKRMNRAVEMVADAESRAAAAAAMATAYQDISDGQAEAARAAADLPAMPARQAQAAGHIANLQKVLHEQMFSASSLIGDWVAGVWAAIVGAIAWVQASVAGAWAGLVGAVSGAAKGS